MNPLPPVNSRTPEATRSLEDDEKTLIKGMEALSTSATDSKKRTLEASEPDQTQSLKRFKRENLPPGRMTGTDIGERKLEIVGMDLSTNHSSPGTRLATDAAKQHQQANIIQCDSRIETGNIAPTKSHIFQCQENCLEFKLEARFGCYILDASFSPTCKNLLISGCDSFIDHSLRTWRQDAEGNWFENGRVVDSQKIFPQLNQSENTLLSVSHEGNVKVSTLNSDGRWLESVALVRPPLEKSYLPVKASFSPLQDKIMSHDRQTGKINVLRMDDNGRWTPLTQPKEISHFPKTRIKPESFKASNGYLLTYNGTIATIWGCSDKSNCLEEKKVIVCNKNIGGAELSNDEQHALIFSQGNQVNFLARGVDGSWSQIGEVHHSEQNVNCGRKIVPNRILTASFNASGQYALTRDLAKKYIISGYDDNGAWVEKLKIPSSNKVDFSPSGRKVLARLGSGSFKIWACNSTGDSLEKGQPLKHIDSDKVIFSPSENLLLSYGNQTNYACIWGDDEEGNLIEKARVCHQGGIEDAAFNTQEDSVLTVGRDCTVKIQGLGRDGKWRERLVVRHQNDIEAARFSSSSRLAFTISLDGTACILGRDDNGEWTLQAVTIPDAYSIEDALFNRLENHFLTYGNKINHNDHDKPGFVQLWGIGDDGKWAKKELITLDHPVKIAKFSPVSDHIMILCENNLESNIPKGGTALLWEIPASPMQF